MRYVLLRDDDTNALTPVHCLERLYRPFLDRGLPVNLAVIPDVTTNTMMPGGVPEGFLFSKNGDVLPARLPIARNEELVRYLLANQGYHIAQHGCHHDYFEFDRPSAEELSRRLDSGTRLFLEAGFPAPVAFVAPYDRLSVQGFREVVRRFRVFSTGWFEWRRVPWVWWPKYLVKKARRAPHWRVGRTLLLSHPGCLLSCRREYDSMLDRVKEAIWSSRVTVLVTHWWEYFRENQADERFIGFLHQTAEYVARQPGIRVLSFAELCELEWMSLSATKNT